MSRRLNLTEEERVRRSELARRLHAERVVDPDTGEERPKFGGPQPNSGPKGNKKLVEAIADLASDDEVQAEALEGIRRGLQSNDADKVRRATEQLLKAEETQRRIVLDERRELEQEQRNAILGRILRQIEPGPGSEADILDAEFSEADEDGTGQHAGGVRSLGAGTGSAD